MSEGIWQGKHLLLLCGPMGCGHIQAAAALETCAGERYPGLKITTINVEEFMSPLLKKIFTNYYITMLNRAPIIWRYVYKTLDSSLEPSMFGRFLESLRYQIKDDLMKRISEVNPDFIICTHFLPAEILDQVKESGEFKTPVSVVVTDFSLHAVYVRKHLDLFFVSCGEVAAGLVRRGVAKEKIHVSGCPICPSFSRPYTTGDITRLKKEFGFSDLRMIMVMMGGESIGRLDEISQTVLKHFPGTGVIALAGRNPRTFKSLGTVKRKYPNRMFPIPFTTRMADYLAVSDLVITKPGGLSISECLAMKKAVVLMDPIPGHEEKNAAYLMANALVAARADNGSSLIRQNILQDDKAKMAALTQRLNTHRRPLAGFDILAVAIEGKDNCRYE